MGTAAEHKSKAEHNHAFMLTIADEYPDWLATAAFYVAVQFIEQLLAESGKHSKDHHQRNTSVRSDFPSIHAPYKALYNASLVARYDDPDDVLPIKEVRDVLVGKKLDHIMKFVRSHLKASGPEAT